MFLGLSIYKLEPKSGVGGGIGGCLLNWKTGLLLYSPYYWSFPSCFAWPLTQLFMAWGLAPDLSHTCQQQQVFCEFSTITVFLLCAVPHKIEQLNVPDFYNMNETLIHVSKRTPKDFI